MWDLWNFSRSMKSCGWIEGVGAWNLMWMGVHGEWCVSTGVTFIVREEDATHSVHLNAGGNRSFMHIMVVE